MPKQGCLHIGVFVHGWREESFTLLVKEQTTILKIREQLYCKLFVYHPSQQRWLSELAKNYIGLRIHDTVNFSKNESRSLQELGIDSSTQLECSLPMDSNVYSMRARILNMRNRTSTTFLYAQQCLKQEHSKKLPNELRDIVGHYCSSI